MIDSPIAVMWGDTAYICEVVPITNEWVFPIGNIEYPPKQWYVAVFHDPSGATNYNNYKHTGLDINIDVSPWGDTERTLGLQIYAITHGVVVHVSQEWYGLPMIVIKHMHNGEALYVRYGHVIPTVKKNDIVTPGQSLGLFADWHTGDHLHFDMSTTKYTTEWFTPGMLNPINVLKEHLPIEVVDEMIKKD